MSDPERNRAGDDPGGPDPAARRRGALYTLLAAVAAAVYLLAFRAGREAPRESFVVAVLAIAAVTNLAWVLRRPRAAQILRWTRRERRVALALALLSAAGNVCVARATVTLGSGPTGALAQTEIFFVAVAAWIALRERIDPRLAAGAVLAAGGVVVGRAPAGAAWDPVGVAWALASAASFALILVVARGNATRVDLERVNAGRLCLAAPLALAVPGAAAHLGELGQAAWAWAALAALAGPVVSRLLQLHAVRELAAARVKLGMLTTPVFAYLLEAALFGRLPGVHEAASAALVLVGVALPSRLGAGRGRR